MNKNQALTEFENNMDKFAKRRIYQLTNWEETYKDYALTHPEFEWDIAHYELDIMILCNAIIGAKTSDLENLRDKAFDMLYGRLDEEALRLMSRCDTTKELIFVHE